MVNIIIGFMAGFVVCYSMDLWRNSTLERERRRRNSVTQSRVKSKQLKQFNLN